MSAALEEPVGEAPPEWKFLAYPGGRLERSSLESRRRVLRPGEVRLRLLAGGICGSDIGALAAMGDGLTTVAPMHEVVGEVTESNDSRLAVGQAVIGTGATGLASELVEDADRFIAVPSDVSVVDAIAIQPISTVLRAVKTLPRIDGRDVVVIGAGAIGLAFLHVLKGFGARHVTAVDPVEARADLARHYGADQFAPSMGQHWLRGSPSGTGCPSLVVDAVGRQPDLIAAALRSVADDGIVLGFGSAADGDYEIPFGEMYHRRLTLASGRTRSGWVDVLEQGAEYLLAHQSDFVHYVSHRFTIDEAQRAYELCSRPDGARVKVALVAST
jgi:threonine dehydrogenase-like Zn-dependent dehydrogenase